MLSGSRRAVIRLMPEEDEMADDISQRTARFIEPFRVTPGSNVKLARDFDPAFKAGIEKKHDAAELLKEASSCSPSARRASQLRTRTVSWSCFRRLMPLARTARSAM
jgi:hypothetical protein